MSAVATLPTEQGQKTVKLRSNKASLHVLLESPSREFSQRYGWVETGPGKKIRFDRGMAEIPADWMPLLEGHSAFTGGRTQPKMVWLESELMPEIGPLGPQVVTGAMNAAAGRAAPAQPPVAGWDAMTAKQCIDLVSRGQAGDLEMARRWEMDHQRRKTVVRAITDAQFGDAPEPQSIDETFTAPLPAGVGGGA